MSFFSPIQETTRGLKAFPKGFKWLRAHPRYFFLLFLPMVFAAFSLIYGWNLFFTYDDAIFSFIFFDKPDSLWLLAPFYLGKLLIYLAFAVVGIVGSVLISNLISCPLYEIVSVAIERDLCDGRVEEVSLFETLKLMGEELKKLIFILSVSFLVLLIPGLNVISTVVTAVLVGWDFYDYPMARRGFSFRERLRFVIEDFWALLGLGLWLIIPFVQIIFFPIAVAGGTILNLETLARRQAHNT